MCKGGGGEWGHRRGVCHREVNTCAAKYLFKKSRFLGFGIFIYLVHEVGYILCRQGLIFDTPILHTCSTWGTEGGGGVGAVTQLIWGRDRFFLIFVWCEKWFEKMEANIWSEQAKPMQNGSLFALLGFEAHPSLCFSRTCLHYRGVSCTWTYLDSNSLCCSWTCLHYRGLCLGCPRNSICFLYFHNFCSVQNCLKFRRIHCHLIGQNFPEFCDYFHVQNSVYLPRDRL